MASNIRPNPRYKYKAKYWKPKQSKYDSRTGPPPSNTVNTKDPYTTSTNHHYLKQSISTAQKKNISTHSYLYIPKTFILFFSFTKNKSIKQILSFLPTTVTSLFLIESTQNHSIAIRFSVLYVISVIIGTDTASKLSEESFSRDEIMITVA